MSTRAPRPGAVWWRRPVNGAFAVATWLGWRGAQPDVDVLLARASRETGLDDFGDPEFREPLSRLVADFAARSDADALGRQVFGQFVLSALRNRLRLTAALKEEPAIAQVPIVAPIFVVGLPRTGTTLLQSLLASVPGLRTPLGFEANVGPVPPWRASRRDVERQVRECERGFAVVDGLAPGLRVAHDFGARLPEECNPLLMTSMRALFPGMLCELPAYGDYVRATAFRGAYEWHRLHLQYLSFRAPAVRWVLKAPAHLASLGPLLRAYPDAQLVFTHRDPVEVLPSMAALAAWTRQLVAPRVDRRALAEGTTAALESMLDAAEAVRASWPSHARPPLDIAYAGLVRDPRACVLDVLARAGVDVAADVGRALSHAIGAHPRHPHGEHRYSLEEFGLRADAVRARFERERARAAMTNA